MDFRKPSRATVQARLLNTHSCTYAHTAQLPPPGCALLSICRHAVRLLHVAWLTAERADSFRQEGRWRRGRTLKHLFRKAGASTFTCCTQHALHDIVGNSFIEEENAELESLLHPLQRFSAGVYQPSFPPALTCFLSRLTVFGSRDMPGIQPRLDTDLIIHLWQFVMNCEEKRQSGLCSG